MTAVKDWAREAAEEIADRFFGPDSGWEPMHVDVEETAAIIFRHCPLERGVAYMPVPRCDGCAAWTSQPQGMTDKRFCARLKLYTASDFGCVRFEKK